ncbi:AraC family transcriptional regulator [Oleiphilus messinensis]|uniref:AraC family transcriptional regulator n=1 Tax=Oleiphilus messinensis TaxID=141451 RepID=A0A1Y0IEN5_9GAMM|nr:AraC family transcriptional regulator [Oleiphilus messinensis]ARU58998.1 AraC family transcriptional regulator [Oleiphilus messinensis]
MDHDDQPTVSAAVAWDLCESLIENGVLSAGEIDLQLGQTDVADVERRVSAHVVSEMWTRARANHAVPHIGLVVGSQIHPNAKGVLSHLIVHASTLGEALVLFEKYIAAMSECEQITVRSQGPLYRIVFRFLPPHDHVSAIERSLAASVSWARYLTNSNASPQEVGFRHTEVPYVKEYHKVFGANVRFSQPEDYLVIGEQELNLPVTTSNPYLKAIVSQRVEGVVARLEARQSVKTTVLSVIAKHLQSANLSSALVASELNMSRQTLHRKLQKEGTNFRQCLEEVRKTKVIEYLKQPEISIDAVSSLLGFSEPSAFFKAFKTWFGTTPRHYRDPLILSD